MLTHHHKNKTEQVGNKARGEIRFHFGNIPDQGIDLMEAKDMRMKQSAEDSSRRLWAYQIYGETEDVF